MVENLYLHFPFCRRKCSYCALYSRAGVSQSDRDAYVRRLAREIGSLGSMGSVQNAGLTDFAGTTRNAGLTDLAGTTRNAGLTDLAGTTRTDSNQTLFDSKLKTIYFGGGSPALCDLSALVPALRPLCGEETEFTVELHPLDVTAAKLAELKALGVNRISMGVQSLDDAVLADMGRGYTVDEAERAFAQVKTHFDNAGIDLIVGYPGDEIGKSKSKVAIGRGEIAEGLCKQWNLQRLESWGLRHCSVYSLQNERGLKDVPDDDVVLDQIKEVAAFLKGLGLDRYEISNYAVPGYECRHNLAVWRGEDYIGLGDGACGRIGLKRTKFGKVETVSAEFNEKERRLFRLRTREGLDASNHPEWGQTLAEACKNGLLTRTGDVYRLTERGTEVCDSILSELV